MSTPIKGVRLEGSMQIFQVINVANDYGEPRQRLKLVKQKFSKPIRNYRSMVLREDSFVVSPSHSAHYCVADP